MPNDSLVRVGCPDRIAASAECRAPVHLTFVVVIEHPHVPEPALAAILVSAVTAIVIWLIYLSIRFGLRLSGGMLWGAIKS